VIKNLPNSFIFHKPKDIVSGDFYWYHHEGDYDILAVLDCTGHGVAGAFMAIMANSILNQIINESRVSQPREILAELDRKVLAALKQQEVQQSNHDMDVAICHIDNHTKKLTFAGAKRPLYQLRDNELVEIKGSKSGIAESLDRENQEFKDLEIEHQPGDTFYISSGGYADQFGGEDNKKYMIKNFKEFLRKSYQTPLSGQAEALEAEIKGWAGDIEQTDDILVIGFAL
jgi:serine phosphatase RsbU (regulator of sigma subunit)